MFDEKRIYNSQQNTRRIEMTVKEKMAGIINELPDDSTYDEILRELAFRRMVERGLKNSNDGKTISNNEMERRIKSWQK
jgi:hypothetical protein